MSRLRSAVSLGVAFVASATGGLSAVAAQQPTEAELIQRIEALLPEYEAARVALDARRRETREAEFGLLRTPVSVDTVRVGPMSILSLPGESDAARDLFTEVWREEFPEVTESPSLRASWFVWRARPGGPRPVTGPEGRSVGVDISRVWARTRTYARVLVADAIARAVIADFPESSAMRAWLSAMSYPSGEAAYRALASGTSGAMRGCMTGESSACMASLGLGLRAGADRLPGWFADQERQDMVDDAAFHGRVDRDAPLYRRCVEENDARACDPILAELDWITAPPASTALLRTHLLWFAAREGGPGSWQRSLARSDAPMPEVLAHMSGRSIEQLVADWRTYVIAQRPDVQAGLGGRGTRVLLWSLIFAAMSLRSTRWRLA